MNKKYVMVIWLFLTALLLTTTTFAWLSANKIFEINSFDIQIVSRGGIEVSADGVNWKGVLGIVDLIEAGETYPANLNQLPDNIIPVSTGGQIENGLLKIYYGNQDSGLDGDFFLTTGRSVEKRTYGKDPDAHFVAFDLFLKTEYRKALHIDPASSIDIVRGIGINNAFRVGFLNQGTVPVNASPNQIQSLRNANKTYIWEPNYDTHTISGIDHAREVYNIQTQEKNAQRIEYYGVISEIKGSMNVKSKDANSNSYSNLFLKVPVDVYTPENNTTTSRLFNIEGGITKIRLYIWIEGQDVDCENNASASDVLINLQFIGEES